jgi:hypothetical protein
MVRATTSFSKLQTIPGIKTERFFLICCILAGMPSVANAFFTLGSSHTSETTHITETRTQVEPGGTQATPDEVTTTQVTTTTDTDPGIPFISSGETTTEVITTTETSAGSGGETEVVHAEPLIVDPPPAEPLVVDPEPIVLEPESVDNDITGDTNDTGQTMPLDDGAAMSGAEGSIPWGWILGIGGVVILIVIGFIIYCTCRNSGPPLSSPPPHGDSGLGPMERRRLFTPFTALADKIADKHSGTKPGLKLVKVIKRGSLATPLQQPETVCQWELPRLSANLQNNLWWIIPASCITQVLWILFVLILRRVCMKTCCAKTSSGKAIHKNRG